MRAGGSICATRPCMACGAPGAPAATTPPMTPGRICGAGRACWCRRRSADDETCGTDKQELQPGGKQVGDTYIHAGAIQLADVGQEPPRPVRFTGPLPPAADGVTTQPTGATVNGRPLVEVGGEPMPLRRSFRHRLSAADDCHHLRAVGAFRI